MQIGSIKILISNCVTGVYLRWYWNGWHYWFFLPGTLTVETEGEKYHTIGTRKIAMCSGQITRGQAQAIRQIMNTREVSLLTISGWMNIRIEQGSLNVYTNQVAGAEIEFVAVIGSKEISYYTGYTPVPDIPVVPPDITYCEVVIDTQVWMCKNFDSKFPGSKVYDDDEYYRPIYGGLYSYNQVMAPGFCPAGWRVPTTDDWNTLIAYFGGDLVAGQHLKEPGTTHWDPPNTGDSVLFKALGAGFHYGAFSDIMLSARFWTSTINPLHPVDPTYSVRLAYDSDEAHIYLNNYPDCYLSVRLMKDAVSGIIYDIDGNLYHWITIGTQQWLVENLKTTKYRDGTPIPNIPDITGSYCWYNNDIANKPEYGALYNWHTVKNAHNLAPAGWRVPSLADFNALAATLGGYATLGGILKEVGLTHWMAPNTGAIDSVGFNARGGGYAAPTALFFDELTMFGQFWSTTEQLPAGGEFLELPYDGEGGSTGPFDQNNYISVRCMRDVV